MKHSTENLRHTRWECKYHVVFIPKDRKRSIYGWVRRELGPIIRDLAQQKESVVDEAHIREYIREQEKEDKRLDQLKIFE